MKKTLLIIAAMLSLHASDTNAQSILDALKNASTKRNEQQTTNSSSTTNSLLNNLGGIVAGLLGIDNVNEYSIVGTWSYDQPAVVFQSENVLTNVGAMAASSSVEKKLQDYLDMIGFTKGKVSLKFNEDKTGNIIYADKSIPFMWSIEGTDVTINLGNSTQSKLTSLSKLDKYTSFKINCKVAMGSMQLSFKADKLAQFISKILSATGNSSNNATLSAIAGAASKIEGMYLGMTFTK